MFTLIFICIIKSVNITNSRDKDILSRLIAFKLPINNVKCDQSVIGR